MINAKEVYKFNTKYKNSKFKILAPTWSLTFDLHDGSYSVSDIQDILSIPAANMIC